MANQWLRLWHEMPHDPKWRTIARVSGKSISEVQAVYLQLLVSASMNSLKRGETQCNAEDIASSLDIDVSTVTAILDAMQSRVLEGNYLKGWDVRQPIREDSSTNRVREHRKRNGTPDKDKEEIKRKRKSKTLARSVPPEELAGTLPLIDGTDYQVSKSQLAEWSEAYPAVNVKQQLAEMKAWLNANPTRKKTPKGICRTIVLWLGKEQDRGGNLIPMANSKPDPLARMRFANGGVQ